MAPSKTGKPASKETKGKKEKIFHPGSRKAGQLNRTQVRKSKLAGQAAKRSQKHSSKTDFYGFFFHAMPDEGVLTLEELHGIVRNVWLTRNDDDLEEERKARRKGRPKSTKETKLEEIMLQEAEQYRTGMEVPDLTHEANVALFRRWDQVEFPYTQLLRHIRISSSRPDVATLSRLGKHFTLEDDPSGRDLTPDLEAMDVVDAPLAQEPSSRFSSTMMTMDGPL
ncbi:hypothetical protein FA95DRAFT_1570257 [Auriscalpium vulgare]|uniref:Uncharacterized protein n=1 Tax=Auriscalpium vulgare TaxID=40419 RepID=A0ACB8S4H6_9AGAM|nr:hypothetical protein FA95DRAFT_1570257 [Auriscalpium vulgare]